MIVLFSLMPVIVVLCTDAIARECSRLERAIRMVGLSEKQACAALQLDQRRWNEMKRAERSLPLHRIAILLPEVFRVYCLLKLQEDGLPTVVEQSAPVVARIQLIDERKSA